MQRAKIRRLILKYLKGTASKEEIRDIIAHYDEFDHAPDFTPSLEETAKNRLKESIHTGIWKLVDQRERRFRLWPPKKWAIRLAAAAMVVIGFTLMMYLMRYGGEVDIVKRTDLVYYDADANSMIMLPDSSSVLLSKGSRLGYAATMAEENERVVILDGQAFFDIRKNEQQPFVVHAGQLEVHVLGTAFNVKAIDREEQVTVTVRRGRVRVDEQQQPLETLLPAQQLGYDVRRKTYKKQQVHSSAYLDWQHVGDLKFENISVKEACGVFERNFGVYFAFKDSHIGDYRFTTRFASDEPMEKVLASICAFTNATYTFDSAGKKVIFSSR